MESVCEFLSVSDRPKHTGWSHVASVNDLAPVHLVGNVQAVVLALVWEGGGGSTEAT